MVFHGFRCYIRAAVLADPVQKASVLVFLQVLLGHCFFAGFVVFARDLDLFTRLHCGLTPLHCGLGCPLLRGSRLLLRTLQDLYQLRSHLT